MSTVVDSEVLEAWRDTQQELNLARPRPGGVGKVRPGTLIMPSELRDAAARAWWKTAPPVLWVDIATGAVLVDELAAWLWPVRAVG